MLLEGVYFIGLRPTLSGIVLYHAVAASLLVINGVFLSFVVSPYLLLRERQGKSEELFSDRGRSKLR